MCEDAIVMIPWILSDIKFTTIFGKTTIIQKGFLPSNPYLFCSMGSAKITAEFYRYCFGQDFAGDTDIVVTSNPRH